MYLDSFFEAIDGLFLKIRTTQLDAIKQAAEVIAASLANGGALAVMDTGHMLRHEALNRAGGMLVIAPFAYSLSIDNAMDQRSGAGFGKTGPLSEEASIEKRTATLALDSSKMKRGDVLIINSNSGRTPNVIEVALECKTRGIVTIGISSSDQMARCPAAHISGRKLIDVVDIFVDNCGPYGDALIEIKDNEKACPGSGLAATYVFWAIHAEAVERLQAQGVNPTIYRSVHVSGHEFIEQQRKTFLEKGI